ncbi:hypothetical protein TKK_0014316 [Trichogramma kaykai]|uniref:Coiled-coil domain-containing protein 22 homolog n=1 Tax=Trichogramma kaykai TaxID=54128 RepID=A0ABD2WE48_9HYME
MEEVDKIIIHSLRQIGCDVEENISSLSSFNTELVVQATIRCLEIIKPELGINPVLPENMAARFRIGMLLAQAVMDLGYKGDVGYQTFLYKSEADLRRVLIFLIEKFPKENDKTIIEPITKSEQIDKLISTSVSSKLSVPWLPYYCHKKRSKFDVRASNPFSTVTLNFPKSEDSEEYKDYAIHYEKTFLEQVPYSKNLLPSIIAANSREELKNCMTTEEKIEWLNQQKYGTKSDTSDCDIYSIDRLISQMGIPGSKSNGDLATSESISPEEEKEDENIIREKKLKLESDKLKSTIEELQTEITNIAFEMNKITAMEEAEARNLMNQEQESKYKLKAFELLENGRENVNKLETAIEAQINKLINLANKWEKHRLPLIEKYRKEKEKYSSEASASQKKLDELRALRVKERELIEECKNKEQQYSQLLSDVEKLPKEINRAPYAQRILEIINNIKKQKDEIDKVLADTREVQKEINTLTGKLERSFAIVDDMIFRDARSNDISKRAYKLLATLHGDCNEIVSLVQETGATIREIRDLEEQIESESSKNIGPNLERITADLKQMRQETAALTAQLHNKIS